MGRMNGYILHKYVCSSRNSIYRVESEWEKGKKWLAYCQLIQKLNRL
jgi:hypothetical protein